MMKTENNPEIRNRREYKNNNQHQETNIDKKTVVAGQGCSLCVDMGGGIGVGCLVCQAAQEPKEVAGERSEVNTGEKAYTIKGIINRFPFIITALLILIISFINVSLIF